MEKQEEGLLFGDIPKIISDLTKKVASLEAKYESLKASKETEQPINVKQAAEFLGKKTQTIYGLISTRQIPHCKVGKNPMFYRSELDKWIKDKGRKVYTN